MSLISVSAGRCQFCHAAGSDAGRIIAGDSGFICEGCVQACAALLSTNDAAGGRPTQSDRYAFQRLARHFSPRAAHEMHATSRSFPLRQVAWLRRAADWLDPTLPRNWPEVDQASSPHWWWEYQRAMGAGSEYY